MDQHGNIPFSLSTFTSFLTTGPKDFDMSQSAAIWGFIGLFTNFIVGTSLDDDIRKLRGKVESFSARIGDLETAKVKAQLGKKRKRDDDLGRRIAQGRGLLIEAQSLLSQLEEGSPQQKRQAREERGISLLKMHVNVQRSFGNMAAHEREADILWRCSLRDGLADVAPSLGYHIPAKELFGQVALTTMAKLQALLLDHKVARMGIQGAQGLGKTAFMKQLHNYAVYAGKAGESFNYVFWVTCPAPFCIKKLQDAVATAIECDLSHISDLILRARKLSYTLSALAKYALFLDAVPEASFSLEQIGIPDSGGLCKLIITTRSDLVCTLLDCSEVVQVNSLPQEEALGLFMDEAGIDLGHVYLLDNIPRVLANLCGGVPSIIVDTANHMRRIYDISEWRNMLFELESHAIVE